MIKRKYPEQPLIGVGAIVKKNDKYLRAKRKNEPNAGTWGLPGGLVELGENVQDALIREVREECEIESKPTKLIDVIDFIDTDVTGKIKYHYVLIDYEAQYLSGDLHPASDVTECCWFSRDELRKVPLPDITYNLFRKKYF